MRPGPRAGVIEGKLSNLGKGMAPDLGVESDDGMWGQADKRSKQGKKQPQHEERAAGQASLSPEMASHHGSHGQLLVVYLGLGTYIRHGPRAPGGTCPPALSASTAGHRPGPDQPDQATARKTRHESARVLTLLGLPISNLTATRILETTPTANSICTLPFVLLACRPGPALPFVTLINCSAAQLSRSRSHGKHHIKVSTMTLDLAQSHSAAAGDPGSPTSGSRGFRPWPAFQSHPRQAFTGHRRDQTSDPSDSSNLLGLP